MSIYTRTLAACKLWLRRWWIRQLIKFADRAEERLHDWQVKLRNDLAAGAVPVKQSPATGNTPQEALIRLDTCDPRKGSAGRRRVSFLEWEARRSGVAPIAKKSRRRQLTAAEFDLRFAR